MSGSETPHRPWLWPQLGAGPCCAGPGPGARAPYCAPAPPPSPDTPALFSTCRRFPDRLFLTGTSGMWGPAGTQPGGGLGIARCAGAPYFFAPATRIPMPAAFFASPGRWRWAGALLGGGRPRVGRGRAGQGRADVRQGPAATVRVSAAAPSRPPLALAGLGTRPMPPPAPMGDGRGWREREAGKPASAPLAVTARARLRLQAGLHCRLGWLQGRRG